MTKVDKNNYYFDSIFIQNFCWLHCSLYTLAFIWSKTETHFARGQGWGGSVSWHNPSRSLYPPEPSLPESLSRTHSLYIAARGRRWLATFQQTPHVFPRVVGRRFLVYNFLLSAPPRWFVSVHVRRALSHIFILQEQKREREPDRVWGHRLSARLGVWISKRTPTHKLQVANNTNTKTETRKPPLLRLMRSFAILRGNFLSSLCKIQSSNNAHFSDLLGHKYRNRILFWRTVEIKKRRNLWRK